MKNTILLFICLILGISSFGQQKELTIEDAVVGRWRQFYPEDLMSLKWRDNERFNFIKAWTEIAEGNIKNAEITSILKLDELNAILEKAGIEKLQYIADYEWDSDDLIRFETASKLVVINLSKKSIEKSIDLKENASNKQFFKKTGSLAYTIDNNLFVTTNDGKNIQITNDQDKGIVNGSDYVHRQEFGIDNGIFWSPDGNYLAFYRKDETMVADYPLVDITTRMATLHNIKYPMAGETSEQVMLGVYNFNTGKTIFLKTKGAKDDYLTRITWDPTEKFIYVAELNRGQNHMMLNKFDAGTGDFITTLFEEKNPKYVEPEHDMYFLKSNPNQFLWFSERDGYQHLYLYETSGKLIKQVTQGSFVVTDFLGFDAKDQNIYVLTTKDSPLERQLYKYNIKSGKALKLTESEGMHQVKLNPDKTFFIDNYSNSEIPRKINLVNDKSKIIKELVNAKDPLKDYKLGEMSIGTLKAADGNTDLYYRMIKPVDFDPAKKYPVIVYVYGGPHAQLVENSWLGGTGLWEYYMAQKGYIMFTLDNRGSANRGLEFENVIHRQCGQEEMKDQMKGIEYLKSLPFVDQDKIGVDGWSYGGFMTISLMVNNPETFKVACAGGPVIDWKYYEVMYGERYMDTPQENPEGYEKTSLLDKVENLKGRLMIIHGGQDPVVVWQNSQDFVKHCIDKGVLLDYFIYPTHEHNVRGKDRIHLMKKITQYFDDFLK
ncbi:MAG: DPP IV N-terminal domain-containing protein [Bacteroidales bacterium]|nr:DPP IV N-terminal domain-containing protein [Bacteroidales bacterium]